MHFKRSKIFLLCFYDVYDVILWEKKWTIVYGSRLSHIFDEPSILKYIFLTYLVYLSIYLVYQIFVIVKRSILTFKGTLMQIWKSASIFVFIWNPCVEDFTLKHLLLFEICPGEICEKFLCKHSETIEYVKN